jgi:hypothetical protein
MGPKRTRFDVKAKKPRTGDAGLLRFLVGTVMGKDTHHTNRHSIPIREPLCVLPQVRLQAVYSAAANSVPEISFANLGALLAALLPAGRNGLGTRGEPTIAVEETSAVTTVLIIVVVLLVGSAISGWRGRRQ